MKITFKINTGTLKTGKNLLSIFKEDDREKLEKLENDSTLLFDALLHSKIKNCFGGLPSLNMREKCDFNIMRHKGINSVTYDKKIKGCFITYNFIIS